MQKLLDGWLRIELSRNPPTGLLDIHQRVVALEKLQEGHRIIASKVHRVSRNLRRELDLAEFGELLHELMKMRKKIGNRKRPGLIEYRFGGSLFVKPNRQLQDIGRRSAGH